MLWDYLVCFFLFVKGHKATEQTLKIHMQKAELYELIGKITLLSYI